MKFTEECVMYREKHVLVKKNLYKWVCYNEKELKNSPWNGNPLNLQEKNVPGTVVIKQGHADDLLGYKKIHHYCLKNCSIENSASYCQLLRQYLPNLLSKSHIYICIYSNPFIVLFASLYILAWRMLLVAIQFEVILYL